MMYEENRKVAVEIVKKSIETMFFMLFLKKVRHVWDGGVVLREGIRLQTVRSDILIPSLSSSP